MIRMVTEYATRSAQSANQVKWRPGPEDFTTESAEGTEAGEGWLGFPDPSPSSSGPISVFSALSVVKKPEMTWLSNRSAL
jgi:hypothetical protein